MNDDFAETKNLIFSITNFSSAIDTKIKATLFASFEMSSFYPSNNSPKDLQIPAKWSKCYKRGLAKVD